VPTESRNEGLHPFGQASNSPDMVNRRYGKTKASLNHNTIDAISKETYKQIDSFDDNIWNNSNLLKNKDKKFKQRYNTGKSKIKLR